MTDFKTPPNCVDREKSLLSAIMYTNSVLPDVIDIVTEKDFYSPQNQRLYKAILGLYQEGEPIDFASVADNLKKTSELQTNDYSYLAELQDYPVSVSPQHHAEKIHNKAVIRHLIEKCQAIITSCYSPVDPEIDILDNAQRVINSVEIGGQHDTFTSMYELTNRSIDRYEQMNRNESFGIMCGYRRVDNVIGGFTGGKLVIIAARPGMGKTSVLRNCTAHMAKNGVPVAVFSAEMDKEDLDDGYTAQETGINSMRLSTGNGPSQGDWEKINRAAAEKHKWPLWIDDTGPLKITELKRRSRILVKMGVKAIWIDQLSKLTGTRTRQSQFEEATECTRECAHLAKELGIPVFLLAQLNRDLEKRGQSDRKPRLSDLKNTGQLEEDASIVMLLYRKYYYTKDPNDAEHAEIEIAKNRGGALVDVEMRWDAKRTLFQDLLF